MKNILFPNETLSFVARADGTSNAMSDQQINAKYAKGEVRIVTEQARYPLNSIVGMIESGDYQLNPEFQRRHRWSARKQARLIESFIMNVPIPPIFLYEDRYSHYEVMDGLQRLTAIVDFYTDKLVLEGLEEWPELNGRVYTRLPEQLKRAVDRRYLSSIILLQETAKNEREAELLKQLVFERINSGGVQLEPQESRNAIYNGPLNKLCIKLARNISLCRAWGIPEPTMDEVEKQVLSDELLANDDFRKMTDVELVLRFFAYRQRRTHHRGRLRDYLDSYLKYGNAFPPPVLVQLESLFCSTIELVYETLGQQAFWLYRRRNDKWSWFQRPTTAVYDPLMYVFSQRISDADSILSKRDAFRAGIKSFYQKNYDDFEGRNTNLSILNIRDSHFGKFVKKVLAR